MSISTKVESLDRDVPLIISDLLSPAAQSEIFAKMAREQLAAAETQNSQVLGHVPSHKTYVDGVAGASEDQVKPGGTIVYEFDIVLEIFAWIEDQLVTHSPVKSGRYAKSHTFYADGVEADPLNPPKDAQEFVFLSLVPYARKIEGAAGKTPESSQAPDGVYEAVATLARRRFGNSAKIGFTFRAASGGDLSEWAASPSAARHAAAHKRRSNPQTWLTNQPAIIITLR